MGRGFLYILRELLVVYPINGTMFGNDYPQQNKLSKCSLKYSIISVVHHSNMSSSSLKYNGAVF